MRHGDSGWISLHPGEFHLLWNGLGFGEVPTALDIPAAGRTSAARAALRDAADRSLAERGLGTLTLPAADVVELLEVLAHPAVRLDLEILSEGGAFRAIGASGPRGHATAGLADGEFEVRMGRQSGSGLVAAMFGAVESSPAGTGTPGNVPVADYLRACRTGEHGGADGFLQAIREAGARPPEANTFLRATGTAHSVGRFGVSTKGGGGSWRRVGTVNWVDTREGRYALRRRDGWVTVTPVDGPRLLSMAEELAASPA